MKIDGLVEESFDYVEQFLEDIKDSLFANLGHPEFDETDSKYLLVVESKSDEKKLFEMLDKKLKELSRNYASLLYEIIDFDEGSYEETYQVVATSGDTKAVRLRNGQLVTYKSDEIKKLVEHTTHRCDDLENELAATQVGIALYDKLYADEHYLMALSTKMMIHNWAVIGILCEENPEDEVKKIWECVEPTFGVRIR